MRRLYVSEPAPGAQSAKDDGARRNVSKSGKPLAATLNSKSFSPVTEYPDPIEFFKHVRPDGYPEQHAIPAKLQPWKAVWEGPKVSKDGKLVVACPTHCDWGSGSGLGGY